MRMQASHLIVFFLPLFSFIQNPLCSFPLYSNNPFYLACVFLLFSQEWEHVIELISLCVVPEFV